VSRSKQRFLETDTDHLVSNLRGEVGEIITSWILLRDIMQQRYSAQSDDIAADLANKQLAALSLLEGKLFDDCVARLVELGEDKVGRLNFFFAARKVQLLTDRVQQFASWLNKNRFKEKRNHDISHKVIPLTWDDNRLIDIPYRLLLKAIALALRLMKQIDRIQLGPAAPFLWREMRKRRYGLTHPAKSTYLLMPYLKLTRRDRKEIILLEEKECRQVWTRLVAMVDGKRRLIPACREWGAIKVNGQLLVFDEYPLISIEDITTRPRGPWDTVV